MGDINYNNDCLQIWNLNGSMDEREFYKHIGTWLMDEKGCQPGESPEFWHGYEIDCPIPVPGTDKTKKPDIVGVRYERTKNKTPNFNFHFYFVEVKGGREPHQIQNLIGELSSLRDIVDEGKLAADTARVYAAVPGREAPADLRRQAEQNSAGILTLQVDDSVVHVRERLAAPLIQRDGKRSEVLSNDAQQSIGNFIENVNNCPVLSGIMEPRTFFEELIRPEIDDLEKDRAYNRAFRYVKDDAAREAMRETIEYLEKLPGIEIDPHTGQSPLFFIRSSPGEEVLKIEPLRRKFKIIREDDVLFRISSTTNFDITEDDIWSISELKPYLENLVQGNFTNNTEFGN